MGWFSQQTDPQGERLEELSRKVAELKGEITALRREKKQYQEYDALEALIRDLKTKKTNLEIQIDKINEKHARQMRETEHLVGLERRKSDFEKTAATREATLKVREENLAHERKAFEEQMKFNTDRFEKTEKNIMEILGQVMDRLPKVEVGHKTVVKD